VSFLRVSRAGTGHAQTKLRFQAAFPSSTLIYENFQFWADRVKAMSGGRLWLPRVLQ
jgi:TRAP-type C4-dicarboxylate transport system substrate-binding protein